MLKSVTDYLDKTAASYADKPAYIDENRTVTFGELRQDALRIASGLTADAAPGIPVVVYMEKSVECIEGFLGVAYTGAFYVRSMLLCLLHVSK